MELTSTAFLNGGVIPPEYAFCAPDPSTHVRLSANRNPDLAWTDVPAGTRSFALLLHDPDVPSRGDDVNQEGRIVPAALPRVDFFHWTLIDIAPDVRQIACGEHADGVTPRGKPGSGEKTGARHGVNDYTGWFAADQDMAGDYFGYDGPCPPWNDAIAHRYLFTLFALDLPQLPLPARFAGPQARAAMKGHVLAQAVLMGRYTLNPAVRL
jgi:Raf kinase inhibitor-like YbhB/YbcL family protein